MSRTGATRFVVMKRTLTLSQLKWTTILAPLLFLGGLDLLRRRVAPEFFATWQGYVLTGAIALIAVLLFSMTIFRFVGQQQRRLEEQNQELLALHHASLEIEHQLDLEAVLHGVVEEARTLVDGRYGALSYLNEDGTVGAFITSGITPEEGRLIGPPPSGHGVLGVVLRAGESLRLDDVRDHQQSIGFPPHHPPMQALLAVPIRSNNAILGNLYIANAVGGHPFTERHEETLHRFAALAALAIENARLHQQVRALATTEERERIAREMHDSLAQVLGYVNAKAQAAQVLLASNQVERASDHLRQMAEASRAAYADVREGILSLRTSLEDGRSFVDTLQDYLNVWREQSGVEATLDADSRAEGRLQPLTEVQLLRIVQEALTNVRKHAGATRAIISMHIDDGFLVTSIRDNGVGFPSDERTATGLPRFGMSTMRERAESVGGAFDVTSSAGEGTCITVRLPVER